ncbi:M1 family metallopeptidase [Spirosoma migulaei]
MKKKEKAILVTLFVLITSAVQCQQPGNLARYTQPGVDVQNYAFSLTLSDSTNQIKGETTIRFTRADDRQTVWFDLISPKSDSAQRSDGSAGMKVRSVSLADGKATPFSQRNDRVFINLPAAPNQPTELIIRYEGTPAKGLIISQNKFGERTFFGDNWPNNARNYLPVVDHPSDKATCSFSVNAPATYRVIANGKFVNESNLPNGRKLTRWQESTPIPTKVMVIGAARFAVEEVGSVSGVPVQSWLYPNDSQKGFIDYRPAKEILQYFIDKIGPYSYEKLANVESTTIFGGMENASCIFYNEKVIVGHKDSDVEALLAHEIAHQWFGNSATESDWSQLWLSEGFATYFSALYLEHAYGKDTLNAVLNQNKGQIFRFSALKPKGTVVDSTTTNLMDLLNPNSYQKGGWVLHMLRNEIGDEAFWKGIRAYYAAYRNRNAQSSDLQAVMETASGKKLGQFFQQWLYQPGYPELVWGSSYDATKKALVIDVRQAQRTGAFFVVPLTFSIRDSNGRELTRTARLTMTEQTQTFTIPLATKPGSVAIDPDNTVLMRSTEMGK